MNILSVFDELPLWASILIIVFSVLFATFMSIRDSCRYRKMREKGFLTRSDWFKYLFGF